jgi:hypothetical protein
MTGPDRPGNVSINSGPKSFLNCSALCADTLYLLTRFAVELGDCIDVTIDELSGDWFWDAELDVLEWYWVDIIKSLSFSALGGMPRRTS